MAGSLLHQEHAASHCLEGCLVTSGYLVSSNSATDVCVVVVASRRHPLRPRGVSRPPVLVYALAFQAVIFHPSAPNQCCAHSCPQCSRCGIGTWGCCQECASSITTPITRHHANCWQPSTKCWIDSRKCWTHAHASVLCASVAPAVCAAAACCVYFGMQIKSSCHPASCLGSIKRNQYGPVHCCWGAVVVSLSPGKQGLFVLRPVPCRPTK